MALVLKYLAKGHVALLERQCLSLMLGNICGRKTLKVLIKNTK